MSEPIPPKNDFLIRLREVIDQNLANELFGVSELAGEMHMSRSNLLRKVKQETNLSVSQFIREVRLRRAMEMIRNSSLNVSEVSRQVGFSSTSYFIKCFREHYGYPPGETGKHNQEEATEAIVVPASHRTRNMAIVSAIVVVLLIASVFVFHYFPVAGPPPLEKSIVVLPFKNDSNDSTNIYLINGLMESTLNNLQKIKDLRVLSRTSAEKYRKTSRTIPEMAKDLKVNYFVEGSGQKIGNRILLNVQLIEGPGDRHLWSRQYRREVKDIFQLQQEVATDIAGEIQAIITPDEKKRIEKNPTDDLTAYDLFLKGRELLYKGGQAELEKSVGYFKQATGHDSKFAMAYADAVIAYFYLDAFQTNKKYGAEIERYSDKALLYDPKLGESLVAKALFYMHKNENNAALPYLEKALEYNPNSGFVIHFLAEFYNIYSPNNSKYLEYALKALQLDAGSQDSTSTSFVYLNLSNAFLQTGFFKEAMKYIDRTLDYYPNNPFGYVKVYIRFAEDNNLTTAKKGMLGQLKKDTTRFDVIREVGNICYMMRDYKSAYSYYSKFAQLRKEHSMDIFRHEDIRIAIAYSVMGHPKEAEEFLKSYKDYIDKDRSIYKTAFLAQYYAYMGDVPKAMANLRLFSKEDNFQYWVLLLKNEPSVASIKDLPEFKMIMQEMTVKFWANHDRIKENLLEKGLL